MYYEYPEERRAYEVKNQYFFGENMVVAPITSPRIKGLNVAKVKTWIPEGNWYDLHTGLKYSGGRMMDLYRTLDSIPVLVKEVSILPFTDEISGVQTVKNPDSLENQSFCRERGKLLSV